MYVVSRHFIDEVGVGGCFKVITVEKWAKNTNLSSFDAIRKGILVEVKGQLNPNEWKNADGASRHRIILGARSVKPIAKPASMMEPQPEAIAS